MDFEEILDQAIAMLQRRGRVSYSALKRQFGLEDDYLADLKVELTEVHELAVDKDGKMLVWKGAEEKSETLLQPPASYTPQHLAERILAEQAAMESRGSANGERKTITALFADLKGSTALIEGLDPEDARAIIDPALQLMMDAVHRYDGYVAQALGDGIFALFGAPIAHEDHPQRALYAALRMQEEMRSYTDTLRTQGRPPLLMRVGLNTGEVVVRSIRKDDLHADYVPVGHSTNLAARMEQLAAPGTILVSEQTYHLTEGYFEFKALGKTQIKGVEEPLNVYEVLGAGPLRTRLQIAARRGLTRFVGRRSELDQLQRALDQAKAGHGQIVGVMGEPGLGKSRLFHEFVGAYNHTPLRRHGCLVLEAFAVSYGKASPYLPIIELLKQYFQIELQDDDRIRRERVMGRVLALDRSLEDTLPYLLSLLGIEDTQSSLQQMDTHIRRQRTFEALKKLFLRESLNQPLLLIFEDLHWIDTETQGFLDTLSESVASAKLLLLVSYRPGYRHEWGGKTYYTHLRLAPLGQEEAEELLTFLLGSDTSLSALKTLILDKTEGTPFFIEEVVQTLIEEGAFVGERGNYRLETMVTELHISPTVHGVLAARIDRLTADEKALLQQLSVIGRQFPMRLVKHVIAQPEIELYRVLASLQAKEYLYEQPAFPEVEYVFKHALTQDVAYGTLLQEQRKALHERTGQAIEALYTSTLEEHYSRLAHHYRCSGNTQKAIEYLSLASQQAVQRAAHEDAQRFLTSALELLMTLPDTPMRAQQELRLQTQLGSAVMAAKGFVSGELESVYERVRELCEQVDEPAFLFPALWGVWVYYGTQGVSQLGRELGEQLLQLAQRANNPAFLIEAHHAMWATTFWAGEATRVREHAEHALALYTPAQHHSLTFVYGGHDPGVCCRDFGALALWLLGYPNQAQQRSQEAVTLARKLAHPFSLVEALGYAGWLAVFNREPQTVHEHAEAVNVLATEQGFPYWRAQGPVLQGWARAEQGQSEEGIAQLWRGIEAMRAARLEYQQPFYLSLLAELYGTGGQAAEGLNALTEAWLIVNKLGSHFYEAELYRLKGELLLNDECRTMNDERRAQEREACFLRAIEIACQQKAKSLELRAATSLARLWQSQGKTVEARELLAPAYDWFTEGFDTADLKEAKALLDQLS